MNVFQEFVKTLFPIACTQCGSVAKADQFEQAFDSKVTFENGRVVTGSCVEAICRHCMAVIRIHLQSDMLAVPEEPSDEEVH